MRSAAELLSGDAVCFCCEVFSCCKFNEHSVYLSASIYLETGLRYETNKTKKALQNLFVSVGNTANVSTKVRLLGLQRG